MSPTTSAPSPAVTPAALAATLARLRAVWWNLGLAEVAERLGKPATDPWVREKFLAFRRLAEAANEFDPATLARILQE